MFGEVAVDVAVDASNLAVEVNLDTSRLRRACGIGCRPKGGREEWLSGCSGGRCDSSLEKLASPNACEIHVRIPPEAVWCTTTWVVAGSAMFRTALSALMKVGHCPRQCPTILKVRRERSEGRLGYAPARGK